MRALITNPETDIFTRYLRVWSAELVKELRRKNNIVFHLDKKNANRKKVTGFLTKKSVDLVLLNGHGDDLCVLGQDGAIIDSENVDLLAGKTVHAMSCSTAKKLGPLAIKAGAKAYVGYNAPFFAPTFDEKNNNPKKDDTAALFLDPAFVAQRALANGKEPAEAVALAKKEYDRSIVKAIRCGIQSDNDQFVGLLMYDKNHLVAIEG